MVMKQNKNTNKQHFKAASSPVTVVLMYPFNYCALKIKGNRMSFDVFNDDFDLSDDILPIRKINTHTKLAINLHGEKVNIVRERREITVPSCPRQISTIPNYIRQKREHKRRHRDQTSTRRHFERTKTEISLMETSPQLNRNRPRIPLNN